MYAHACARIAMNPIEFLAHLINILMACSALQMTEVKLNNTVFQVQSWTCETSEGRHVLQAWSRECTTGVVRYWGRPFYLHIDDPDSAEYLDRFGSFHYGQGARMDESYVPACGA
jgi:hypothetical protein